MAEQSQSNYPQTALSLASSLNYAYLEDLVEANPFSYNRDPLVEIIRSSTVLRLLKQNGYRTITSDPDMDSSENEFVDVHYKKMHLINTFEWELIRGSAAIYLSNQIIYEDIRQGHLATFRDLERAARLAGPKFVFAHLIAPHPPFVFKQDGSPISIGSGTDGSYFTGSREDYLHGYREQVLYVTQAYEQIIDDILTNSKTPPIIILQGDHGPGAYLDWDSLENTCLSERMSILNAYYLPGQQTSALYPSISPVNSFRVVLNAYFGQDLPLLPDRQYYAMWKTPYQWIDVTGKTDDQCPAWTGEVIGAQGSD